MTDTPRAKRGSRWLLTLVVVASTLLAVVVGEVPASAATPVVDEQYVGMTTDLADFSFGILDGALSVTSLNIGSPTAPFSTPCFDTGTITLDDPIAIAGSALSGGTVFRNIVDPSTSETRVLQMSARFSSEGIATGSIVISTMGPDDAGVICTARSFGWAAVARVRTDSVLAGGTYTGAVTAGQTFDGLLPGGTASFGVSTDGTSATNLAITSPQVCSVTNLGPITAPLTEGSGSFVEDGVVSTASPVVGRYRVAISGSSGVGVFYVDRGKLGCPPLAGMFTVTGTGGTAVPVVTSPAGSTPTPAASGSTSTGGPGTFASPPVYSPDQARLAQTVFLGGTIGQLDIALVSAHASGAWAQTTGGSYQLYVVGAPSFANVAFVNAFPGGITTATALTLVGK